MSAVVSYKVFDVHSYTFKGKLASIAMYVKVRHLQSKYSNDFKCVRFKLRNIRLTFYDSFPSNELHVHKLENAHR